jgi:hypothetical protein
MSRGGVAGNVGPFGVGPEHLFHRGTAGLDVDLVVRQEQRSVDVEQHEPAREACRGQAVTTASTAARNERT